MATRLLQGFLERRCPDANVAVDFNKLLAADADTAADAPVKSMKLVVDAESCLDRLYGGKHADWVAGGQWNRMVEFLTSLRDSCQAIGLGFVVVLNGALEKQHMKEWGLDQTQLRRNVSQAMREVQRQKRTPAARLWVAPASLRTTLRLALRHLGIETLVTTEDHRLEVIQHARETGADGLMARHPTYIVFNPPRYFAANLLKLTFKKEVLTTEFVVDTLAQSLDLHPDRFCVLGALLGNHILTMEDLKPFHDRLFKAAAPAADAAPTDERATKKTLVDVVVDFVRRQQTTDDLNAIAKTVFEEQSADADALKVLTDKLKAAVLYFYKGTEKGFAQRQRGDRKKTPIKENAQGISNNNKGEESQAKYAPFASDSEQERTRLAGEMLSPATSVSQMMLLRHQQGLLSPAILQIFTHRQIKIDSIMQDETKPNTPKSVDLFRPLRQKVYGILLDTKSKAEDVQVNEWYVTKNNVAERPDPVAPIAMDWDVPTLKSLWLGENSDDGQRRLRAFLSCLKADDGEMLDPEKVPRQFLVLCAVLRYMLEYGKDQKAPILSKGELEAILATAVCPVMKNVRMTKEMKLRKVYARGLSLGALLMQGVEFACLANDACAAPVPWQMTCPWEFFDGKIFHLKLIKLSSGSKLLEACDNDKKQLEQVERMRDAILGTREFVFADPKILVGNAAAAAYAAAAEAKSKKGGEKPAAEVAASKKGKAGKPASAPVVNSEAEAYAAAYAQAYVAYCSGGAGGAKKSAAKDMAAEAYAKGFAAAAVGGAMGSRAAAPTRPVIKPPRVGFSAPPRAFMTRPAGRGRGRGGQNRFVREAAEYANFHTFGKSSATPKRQPWMTGFRGAKRPSAFVDFRAPYGTGWTSFDY